MLENVLGMECVRFRGPDLNYDVYQMIGWLNSLFGSEIWLGDFCVCVCVYVCVYF